MRTNGPRSTSCATAYNKLFSKCSSLVQILKNWWVQTVTNVLAQASSRTMEYIADQPRAPTGRAHRSSTDRAGSRLYFCFFDDSTRAATPATKSTTAPKTTSSPSSPSIAQSPRTILSETGRPGNEESTISFSKSWWTAHVAESKRSRRGQEIA